MKKTRDLIVVGASAGGVEALSHFVGCLPKNLAATVLVVLHIPAHAPSRLDSILQRFTSLDMLPAKDGAALRHGVIYVAQSDRHLMVEKDVIRMTRGPKECRMRPAVDVLFRSAATEFGTRVIGVVLSGALDDGTAGLWAIKDRGGIALVQEPATAEYSSMPESAIAHVDVDLVAPVQALAQHAAELVGTTSSFREAQSGDRHAVENVIAMEGNGLQAGVMNLGNVSKYTCPDCHGVLVQIEEGTIVRFRCHTGHAFSVQTLLAEVNEAIDTGLWDTLRAIEERVMLLKQMAELYRKSGAAAEAERCKKQAEETEERLKPIRELVLDPGFFGH
jgi:two-component system chemotaxis response regulator CheB